MDTDVVSRLRAAGCVFAEDEARILLAAAGSPAALDVLLARRVAGEPLEHVVGWAEFCGLRIAVGRGVFVPRRRTEFLAERAVALVGPGAVVVDLCCGTGAVAAAVLAAVPDAEVHAADVDPAAVALARRNLPGGHVHEGDLDAPLPAALRGRVDVLVANAPYVPTDAIALMPPEARLHEARAALDGGSDGTAIQQRVAAAASRWLAPGGHLLIETSDRQAPLTAAVMERNGLVARVVVDDEREATVVIGSVATVDEPGFLRSTRESYDAIAAEYVGYTGDELSRRPSERAVLRWFADIVGIGPVVDVGCGTGRITAHLHGLGVDVSGIDLSPGMVEQARRTYPDLRFSVGSMTALPLPDACVDGLVAHYSTIHVPDDELPGVLAEFARVLSPGGHALLTFQVGDEPLHLTDALGHPVDLLFHRRRPERMAALLEAAGLPVHAQTVRQAEDEERTPQAHLLARRP